MIIAPSIAPQTAPPILFTWLNNGILSIIFDTTFINASIILTIINIAINTITVITPPASSLPIASKASSF